MSQLLNVIRRDWNVNCIFGTEEFGECSFCWIWVSGTRSRKRGQNFSNAKSIHLHTRKRLKKSHILMDEVWTIIFVPICLILASILFQFIFASFFLDRPSWGSNKSTCKSSLFFEFLRIIAYEISIDLVLLWCKLFLVLLPRSWIVLVLLPRSPKIFLDFFPRSWKILQIFAKLAKILAKNLKNPRIFLARNPRFFLVLLPRSWIVLVFLPRTPRIFMDFFPRS